MIERAAAAEDGVTARRIIGAMPRATHAGRPQRPSQGRRVEGHRRRAVHRRHLVSEPAARAARSVRRFLPARSPRSASTSTPTGFTIVDFRDIPGRNIVALIEDDQPCLAERAIRHVAEPILLLAHEDRETLLAADVQIDYRQSTPIYDAGGVADRVQDDHDREGRVDEGFAVADLDRRRRVPDGASGAALHRAERGRRRARQRRAGRRRRDHRVRIDAVPVLRAPRADGAARAARRQGPRGADRNRRRLRREGRIPVDDRRARRAAREEVRPPGEADLRPRRGHGRDHQAASGDHPAPDRRDARRPAHRRSRSTRCSTAAPTRRSAPSCCRAASFTPAGRTAAITSASAAARR